MPQSPARRPLLAVYLVALGLLAAHFGTRWFSGHSVFLSRKRATMLLEEALLELRLLHVTGYRELSWCRLLTLDGVTYSDSTNPSTCCWASACRPFDPAARSVYAKVGALLLDTGVRVVGFTASEQAADFALAACPFCRDAYEYRAPGQSEPDAVPHEIEYERIRPGWYLRRED